MGNDGSIFLAGDTNESWSGDNAGDLDFVACKLDANGEEVWKWQVNCRHQKRTTVLVCDMAAAP